jgi:hypothetical protein
VIRVTPDQWDASTVEIARLIGLANGENKAIRKLEGSVAEIRQVQAAKAALRSFTPSELDEARSTCSAGGWWRATAVGMWVASCR